MGVGTFYSDFYGTGTSFTVSGPTVDDASTVETASEDLLQALETAASELGMAIPRPAFRASFDRDFGAIANNPVIAIGWRGWEHDTVVAIAGNGRWVEWMDKGGNDDTDMVATYGLGSDMARDTYDELVKDVAEYVRLTVMQAGFECSFRTGAHSSEAYVAPVAPETLAEKRKADLRRTIAEAVADLGRPLATRMGDGDRVARVQLASTIASQGLLGTAVLVPFYDRENGVALCYDAIGDLFTDAISPPEEIVPHLEALEGMDGIAPIPRDDVTDTWLRALQVTTPPQVALLVSLDEYQEAYGEGLDVRYLDDETSEPVEYHFSAPAPGPDYAGNRP